MRSPSFWSVLAASMLLAIALPSGRARCEELPHGKQAIFLARAIAYDGNLKKRAGAAVNIAVLAKRGDKDSERMADLIEKAFTYLESATMSGLPVRISRIYVGGRDALDRSVEEGGIDTFYVCDGLEPSLSEIKEVARSRKVLTLASRESHLKQGLSLGVFEIDGKNTIIVNLEASREEGVVFGPELLRLATVVR
jgi:hypothetical protein